MTALCDRRFLSKVTFGSDLLGWRSAVVIVRRPLFSSCPHAITQRHRSREFVALLQKLDAACAVGVLLCVLLVLLDNHSAHRSREIRRFLATKPGRLKFIFTPTHASWLNCVEIFFSKMSRSVLRGIRVASKDELRDRMQRYIETCNECPRAPKWSYGIHRDQELLAA